MTRRLIIAAIFTLLASGCAVSETRPSSAPESSSPPQAVKTRDVDQLMVEDFSNVATMMRWSDRVFSGTVLENLGIVVPEGSSLPGTVFRVRVDKSFGAPLGAEVLVYQDGGFDESENALYTFNGDPLLEVGKQYMLAGRAGGPAGAESAIVVIPDFGTVAAGDANMPDLIKAAQASSQRRS